MSLKPCKECGHQVSPKAKSCPNCGSPTKAKTSPVAWALLALIIFGVISAISNEAPSPKSGSISSNNGSTPAGAGNVTNQRTTPSTIEVDLRTLLDSYADNEIYADNKYQNKTVRTSGIITDIGKDILDDMYVTLSYTPRGTVPELQAYFDDSAANQLAMLKTGSRITVTCQIDGLFLNVQTESCIIN